MSICLIPRWDTASMTAFWIAGVECRVPLSGGEHIGGGLEPKPDHLQVRRVLKIRFRQEMHDLIQLSSYSETED